MARAIIRYSFDRDNGTTNTQIRNMLEAKGFDKIGTSSFEADNLPQPSILDALEEVVDLIRVAPGGGTLDHLWVYVDEPTALRSAGEGDACWKIVRPVLIARRCRNRSRALRVEQQIGDAPGERIDPVR